MGCQITNCQMRELLFSSRSASCLLVFFPFVLESSCLNTNLQDIRLWEMTIYLSTYCWSSISKPIKKKPVIDTLCRCTRPDASWRASSHANARQTSCKVVVAEARSVIVYTVAHKTVPMFCCFGQMDLVWSDDISKGSEIYVKQTTPSRLYRASNVMWFE